MSSVEPRGDGVWGEAPAARHVWQNLGRFYGFLSIYNHGESHVLNACTPVILLFWRN